MRIALVCIELEVPRGGYIAKDTPRCVWCNKPLAMGRRSRVLMERRPDKYAPVCIPCAEVISEDAFATLLAEDPL